MFYGLWLFQQQCMHSFVTTDVSTVSYTQEGLLLLVSWLCKLQLAVQFQPTNRLVWTRCSCCTGLQVNRVTGIWNREVQLLISVDEKCVRVRLPGCLQHDFGMMDVFHKGQPTPLRGEDPSIIQLSSLSVVSFVIVTVSSTTSLISAKLHFHYCCPRSMYGFVWNVVNHLVNPLM